LKWPHSNDLPQEDFLDKADGDEERFNDELEELKRDMKSAGAVNTQRVMGEATDIRKIHTREMSRLFKSKKEIYQIILIEG
jgi:hypothetical protein